MNRRTRITALALLIAVAAPMAASCSSSQTTATGSAGTAATSAPKPGVTVANQWARQSPAKVTAGAAYMDITSGTADKLIAASVPSSVAAKTELHETVADDGSTGTTAMGGAGTTMKGQSGGGGTGTTTGTMGGTGATTGTMGGTGTTTGTMGGTGTTTGTMGGGEEPMGMTMRPVGAIDLPAGTTVQLKPGGYHIMLLDLVKPLVADEIIEVTLTFETAGQQTIKVPVRAE